MSLNISGKLVKILDVESGTSKAGKEWKKGGLVIDTGSQYNPEIAFSLFGEDKIKLTNNYKVGDELTVSFNLSSREHNGKYYSSVDAWSIARVGEKQMAESNSSEDESGDLPF